MFPFNFFRKLVFCLQRMQIPEFLGLQGRSLEPRTGINLHSGEEDDGNPDPGSKTDFLVSSDTPSKARKSRVFDHRIRHPPTSPPFQELTAGRSRGKTCPRPRVSSWEGGRSPRRWRIPRIISHY